MPENEINEQPGGDSVCVASTSCGDTSGTLPIDFVDYAALAQLKVNTTEAFAKALVEDTTVKLTEYFYLNQERIIALEQKFEFFLDHIDKRHGIRLPPPVV